MKLGVGLPPREAVLDYFGGNTSDSNLLDRRVLSVVKGPSRPSRNARLCLVCIAHTFYRFSTVGELANCVGCLQLTISRFPPQKDNAVVHSQ